MTEALNLLMGQALPSRAVEETAAASRSYQVRARSTKETKQLE